MEQKMLDCAVVGGGPAGLSAAINLHQRGKSVRVLGAAPGFLEKAERVDNYLGLPGLSGGGMLRAFADHAAQLGIRPEPGRVANILPMGDHFMLNFSGDILEARTVVLACGVAKAKPVEGETEFLGRGVSYCATCDGCSTGARLCWCGAFPPRPPARRTSLPPSAAGCGLWRPNAPKRWMRPLNFCPAACRAWAAA